VLASHQATEHDSVHHSVHRFEVEEQARQYAEKITEQIAGLQVFTAALSEALTPAAVAAIGLEQAVAILDAAAGSVLMLRQETSQLEILASLNYSEATLQTWHALSLQAPAPLPEAVRTGQIITIESCDVLAAYYPKLLERHLPSHQASVSIPLIVEATAIGGMTLAFDEPRSFSEEDRLFIFTLGRQLAQALKRAGLYEEERAARAEAEDAGRRLRFLSEASAFLAGSLDYRATLAQVAGRLVPEIADWCAVDLLNSEDVLERAAVAGSERQINDWSSALLQLVPTDPTGRPGPASVARTGASLFYPTIPAGILEHAPAGEEYLRLRSTEALRSLIIVPLKHGEHIFGAITLAAGYSGRSFGPPDLALAEELAGRAALAIEKARLYLEANRLNELLEQRVAERTREIHITNWQLEQQVEERLRVEEVLRQSELRLAEAQRIARLGGWQWHKESDQLTWSAELYHIHGIESPGGTISYEEAFQWIDPDDREHVQQMVEAAVANKEPFAFYHRIIRRDGQKRVIHVRGQMLFDQDGAVAGMLGTGQDVTELKQTEAQLARHIEQLDVLQEIGQAVVTALHVDEVLQRVYEQVTPLLGAEGVAILLRDQEELVCHAATGAGAATLQGRRVSLATGYAGKVMHTGQPLLIKDLTAESKRQGRRMLFHDCAGPRELPVQSLMLVPLQLQGSTIGVIEAVDGEAGAFDDEDVQLLAAAANWTAIAIDNARQHERLQRRLQESEALAAISRELSETLDLGRTLRRIARAAQRISSKVDGVVMHLLEPGGLRLQPVMVAGMNHNDLSAPMWASPDGIIGRVFYQGDVIHIADLQMGDSETGMSNWPARSLLAIPIGGSGKDAAGVLTAVSGMPGAFSPEDERLLTTLALQAGLAIQNTRLFEALEQEKGRLELLYNLSQNLSTSLDPGEVAERALQLMLPASTGQRGEILLLQADSGELHSIASSGYSAEETAMLAVRQLTQKDGLVGHVIQTRTAVAVGDIRHSEIWEAWPGLSDKIRSLAVMPLLAHDELAGVLCLMSEQPSFYRQEELPLLQAATMPVALAVTNARLYRAEQRARQVAERLFEEVRTSRERLRQMAEEVVSAQEEERRRLSRELHDEAGQALTGISISLSLLREELPAGLDTLHELVNEAITVTNQTMEQVRTLAHALHPPVLAFLGLGPALEGFCRDFNRRTRLPIFFSGCELPDLPGGVSVCFYRFLQEALTNTVKHAGATKVEATLTYNGGEICLRVIDDGRGFNREALPNHPGRRIGLGILGMQERFELLGGTLEIESEPGKGVHLTARLPWREGAEAA
jgi:signal transduction histidine kinase/PAS domain-containing protein